jgi:hypothetical protein
MEYFFKRLDDVFADKDQVCNFAFWLQAFAFDVIGEVTFSKRIGFLTKGEDIDGIMGSIWKYFTAASPVSHPPSSEISVVLVCHPFYIRYASKFSEHRHHQYSPRRSEIQDYKLLVILTQVGVSNAMAGFGMDQKSDKTTSEQSQTEPDRQLRSGARRGASDSYEKGFIF